MKQIHPLPMVIDLPLPLLSRVALFLPANDQDRLVQVEPRMGSFVQQVWKQQQKLELEKDKPKDKTTKSQLAVVADAETLLARLNTKILGRRLRWWRCHSQEAFQAETGAVDGDKHCYRIGKTTKEIAQEEWNALVARHKAQDRQKESGNLQTEHQVALPNPSLQLLLFSPCPRPVTILASYPRSGNSLMRQLFESITLRVSGSDMRGGLTQHDLVGEAAVSAKLVQLVKTHFPERVEANTPFAAARIVLLVRNPYDALESFFQLMMTNTHTTSLRKDQRDKPQTQRAFEEMVLKEVQVWRKFHDYWLQLAGKIPILLIRYEDLIRHPDKVMERVIPFVLQVQDMAFFRPRIQECIVSGSGGGGGAGGTSADEHVVAGGAYKPRSGGIGKSMHRYCPQLLRKIQSVLCESMHQFGYGEMVTGASSSAVVDPTSWKLDPIPNYAFEIKRTASNNNAAAAIIKINQGPSIRAPQWKTDWNKLRKELGLIDGDGQQASDNKDDIRNAYHV